MNDVTFTILQLIVSISMIIIMRYVIPYLKIKLTSVIDAEVWKQIKREVKSVEQTISGSKMGVVKKEEVLVRITAWANAHGINITQDQLSQLIESAVWIMNNEDKKDE